MRLAGLVANGYTTNETFKFLLDRPIKRRRQAPGFRGNLYGDCSASGSTGGRRQRRGDSRAEGECSLSGSCSTRSRRQWRGDSRTEGECSLSSSSSASGRRQGRGDAGAKHDTRCGAIGALLSRNGGSACKCSGSADGEKKYGKRHTCGQKINFFHGKSPCAGQNYIQSTPKV